MVDISSPQNLIPTLSPGWEGPVLRFCAGESRTIFLSIRYGSEISRTMPR